MATIAVLDSGISTSNGFDTASIDWGTDTAGILVIVPAYNTNVLSCSVSGGGCTWVELDSVEYATRRDIFLFQSQDGSGNHQTPTDGALTITASGTTIFREIGFFVLEAAAWDGTTLARSGTWSGTTSGTTLSTGAMGTITGTDIAIIGAGFEVSATTTGAASGSTEIGTVGAGGDVRHVNVCTSTTDSTPGVTSSASTNIGAVGIIVRGGSTGTHAGGGGGGTTSSLTLLGVGN